MEKQRAIKYKEAISLEPKVAAFSRTNRNIPALTTYSRRAPELREEPNLCEALPPCGHWAALQATSRGSETTEFKR